MRKKKVLIVPDSFKGSLSSKEVAEIIASAFSDDKFDILAVPVSDGGDGAIDVLMANKKLIKKRLKTFNAYGIIKETEYLIDNKGEAYVAVSGASGIQFSNKTTLNPLNASTYGTGQVIDNIINSGTKVINFLLGGSATIDGGTGMLAALGAIFYKEGKPITPYRTNPLVRYDRVNADMAIKKIESIKINIITDVDNLITGESGAAVVYGPQKGASTEQVKAIENKMIQWVNFLESKSNKNLKLLHGMGAAGGIALPLMAFSNCNILQGAAWFIDNLNIKELIGWSDIIITGEGSIDRQTSMGKIPGEIAKIAIDKGKVVIGVCGRLNGKAEDFDTIYSLTDKFNVSVKYAMTNAKELLGKIARSIADKI